MQYSVLLLAVVAVTSALVAPAQAAAALEGRAPYPTPAPAPEAEALNRPILVTTAVSSCPAAACITSAAAIPTCASGCLSSAGSVNGCVKTHDFACQCSKSAAIQMSAQSCVLKDCGLSAALQVLSSANALCSCEKLHPETKCATKTASKGF